MVPVRAWGYDTEEEFIVSNNTNDVVAVATLVPASGKGVELEEALRVAIRKTHQEPGCRR